MKPLCKTCNKRIYSDDNSVALAVIASSIQFMKAYKAYRCPVGKGYHIKEK